MSQTGPNARFGAFMRRDVLEQFDRLCEYIGVTRTQGLEMALVDVLRKAHVKTPLLGWPDFPQLDPDEFDPTDVPIEAGEASTNPLAPQKELVKA